MASQELKRYLAEVISELDRLQFGHVVVLIMSRGEDNNDIMSELLADIAEQHYIKHKSSTDCANAIFTALVQMTNNNSGAAN